MQPNAMSRRPNDPQLDDGSASVDDAAGDRGAGFDGLTVQTGLLFIKGSPKLGVAPLTGKRGLAATWAVPMLLLSGILAIAFVVLQRHRGADGLTRALPGGPALRALPADGPR